MPSDNVVLISKTTNMKTIIGITNSKIYAFDTSSYNISSYDLNGNVITFNLILASSFSTQSAPYVDSIQTGVAYGNYLFFATNGSSSRTYIVRYDIINNTTISYYTGISGNASSMRINSNGTLLYYINGGDLYQHPFANNNSSTKIVLTGSTRRSYLCIIGTNIYILCISDVSTDFIGGTIDRYNITSKVYTRNVFPTLPQSPYTACDSNNVDTIYLTTESSVSTINVNNGRINTMLASGFNSIGDVGLYKTSKAVYYYNSKLFILDYLTTSTFSLYYVDLKYVCFKEDSLILTDQGYVPVQDLRSGHLVRTVNHGYIPVYMIVKKEIYHPASEERIKDQLYQCSSENYPDVFEPLIITGCHSILVKKFVDEAQKKKTDSVLNGIYVTDKHYRLPACVDERATVYDKPGTHTIYHFALENDDYLMNYGIYANGLLVETSSKRYLTELANMELVE